MGNVTFTVGDARHLSTFPDRSFSASLAINGAITFSAQKWRSAVAEACRVADRLVVLTAASFVTAVPAVIGASLSSAGSLQPFAERMVQDGFFDGNDAAHIGLRFPSYQSVFPEELAAALEESGFRVEVLRGVASLCRLAPEQALSQVVQNAEQLERFLTLEDRYSSTVGLRSPAREWLSLARRTNP
jgi:ubiquinone/menaquinone biosynthesis C-methylase UbiE